MLLHMSGRINIRQHYILQVDLGPKRLWNVSKFPYQVVELCSFVPPPWLCFFPPRACRLRLQIRNRTALQVRSLGAHQ